MIVILRLLVAANVLASFSESVEATGGKCSSGTCAVDFDDVVKGSAMLQVRHTSAVECSVERTKQQPLTETGFQEISKSCCYEDMKVFAARVIDDMGLKVCDDGGLTGLAPFYSCPITPASFGELKADLKKAMPSADSKCHWLQERYAECTEPALECAVSAQKPPPAPKPVASGFLAMKVTNPSEMLRSAKALEVVTQELALTLGVSTKNVNVVIGSGPLDGEEVVSLTAVNLIPRSQAFFSLEGTTKICKVFAVFSVQDSAPKTSSSKTPASTLDEQDIVGKLKHLNMDSFGKKVTQDMAKVDTFVGSVEMMEETVCEKTSLRCTHEVVRERA